MSDLLALPGTFKTLIQHSSYAILLGFMTGIFQLSFLQCGSDVFQNSLSIEKHIGLIVLMWTPIKSERWF